MPICLNTLVKTNIKKIFQVPSLILLPMFLCACPMPMTNGPVIDSYKNYENASAPFGKKTYKATVYIVQPYMYVDWYMLFGASSDAFSYGGSRLYLKTQNGQSNYIGTVSSYTSLCFYALPGNYQLNFDNGNATPNRITRLISIKDGSENYYALSSKSYTYTNPEISFKSISASAGKFYLKKTPPAECIDLTALPAEKRSMLLKLKLVNSTDKVVRILSTQESNITTLIPHSIWTYDKKHVVFRDDNLTSTSMNFLLDDIAASGRLNRNTLNVAASCSKNAKCNISVSTFRDYRTPQYTPVKTSSNCKVTQKTPNITVACTATIYPSMQWNNYEKMEIK